MDILKNTMLVAQLCGYSLKSKPGLHVDYYDLKFGINILNYSYQDFKQYDLLICSVPCDQFTKTNSLNWEVCPVDFIKIAQHVFNICIKSQSNFIFENPPGRVEKFVPGLTEFRRLTFQDLIYNKESVLYSNLLLLDSFKQRYGKMPIPRSKSKRELFTPTLYTYFYDLIEQLRSSSSEFSK